MPGNSNRRFFHGPGINNWDFSLHKSTLIREKDDLEFGQNFSMFSITRSSPASAGDILGGNFGQVTQARAPRIGQVALKFSF